MSELADTSPAETSPADTIIAALRRNHDDLAARVREFDGADLTRRSGALKWQVAQVLSHLGSGAEIMLGRLRAARTGEDAPGQDFSHSVWGRWNAMDPPEQADGFVRANEELVSAYEGLDPRARRDVRVALGFLPFPAGIALLSAMQLNEAALHGWDVRVAFDPLAGLANQEADISLEQITGQLNFLLGFQAKPAALDGKTATLRVDTTDPNRALGLVLGPTVGLGDPPDKPDGILAGPAEAFVRPLAGRLRPANTPGGVTLTGDVITLDELRAVFPGY